MPHPGCPLLLLHLLISEFQIENLPHSSPEIQEIDPEVSRHIDKVRGKYVNAHYILKIICLVVSQMGVPPNHPIAIFFQGCCESGLVG